jgi:hypothetical protein
MISRGGLGIFALGIRIENLMVDIEKGGTMDEEGARADRNIQPVELF